MNHTFKFRAWAWLLHSNAMIYSGDDLGNFFDHKIHGMKHVLMQFTGLFDRHEKEIYEGDIVRCGYGTGKVIFNAGCFMVQWLDDKEASMELLNSRKFMYKREGDEQFEVIGNIFENQEILQQYA